MDYHCRHCGVDLDGGDIYEHYLAVEGDKDRALRAAKTYGWREENRLHFTKSVIVQPDRKPQHEECPACHGVNPLQGDGKDIGLKRCLIEHKEGNWYGIWKESDGTYRMYCFACDVWRSLRRGGGSSGGDERPSSQSGGDAQPSSR